MPFIVRLSMPSMKHPESPQKVEAQGEDVADPSPTDDQASAAWGMTLVLKEHIDLLYEFPDGLYQHTLVRELGASAGASSDRFAYVGCEEGAEPGTVLVHVNIRPATTNDVDQRSAVDLSHAIGAQVEDTSSMLFKGVITRKVLHVGLHLPLKKLADEHEPPMQKQNEAPQVKDENDVGQSLSSMIHHVKQMMSPRTLKSDGCVQTSVPGSSKILSPGGQLYTGDDLASRSQKQDDENGKVSFSR